VTHAERPGPGPDRGFMTTEEVAGYLRTSPATVRFWRYRDYGPPSLKVGRRVLYAEADVEAWLKRVRLEGRR